MNSSSIQRKGHMDEKRRGENEHGRLVTSFFFYRKLRECPVTLKDIEVRGDEQSVRGAGREMYYLL